MAPQKLMVSFAGTEIFSRVKTSSSMEKILGYIAGIILCAMIAGCKTASDDVSRDTTMPESQFMFEYRVHNGLDCFMHKDCGFTVQIDHADSLRRWNDTGQPVLVLDRQVSPDERDSVMTLLKDIGFFDLPELIPSPMSRRGMRTVTLRYRENSSTPELIVTAFMDETQYPFPDGFLRFEERLHFYLDSITVDG